jgi:putative endonuclease
MQHKDVVGRFGEELARRYLEKEGYLIVGSNIKLSYREIDIVCLKEGLLVFVEVKTRTSDFLGGAENALGSSKLRLLKKAAAQFVSQGADFYFRDIRFDFVAIDIDKASKKAKVKHYRDIA